MSASRDSENLSSHLNEKFSSSDTDKECERNRFKDSGLDIGLCSDENNTLFSLVRPLSFFKNLKYKANKGIKRLYVKKTKRTYKTSNDCNKLTCLSIVDKTIMEEKQIHKFKDQNYMYSSRFMVKASEMKEFFYLTEDPIIQRFLKMDGCRLLADKYLVSMVFAYFKRAEFSLQEYNQLNFFVALYLAYDVEEDEEELKYEILPWALGEAWNKKYKHFLKLRDMLFRRMDYKAIVSRRCCEEIMAVEPEHELWKRCRPLHHGGAIRSYVRDSSFGTICGPLKPPRFCKECDLTGVENDPFLDFLGPDDIWKTLEE